MKTSLNEQQPISMTEEYRKLSPKGKLFVWLFGISGIIMPIVTLVHGFVTNP